MKIHIQVAYYSNAYAMIFFPNVDITRADKGLIIIYEVPLAVIGTTVCNLFLLLCIFMFMLLVIEPPVLSKSSLRRHFHERHFKNSRVQNIFQQQKTANSVNNSYIMKLKKGTL